MIEQGVEILCREVEPGEECGSENVGIGGFFHGGEYGCV